MSRKNNKKKKSKKCSLCDKNKKKVKINPTTFYNEYFLSLFLNNPKMSRFNYPDKNILSKYLFLKYYNNWLAYNNQYYINWTKMFASQNSPSIYSMGSSIIIGSDLPYN